MSRDLAAIVTKHVEACVLELKEAVRDEMRAVLGGGLGAPSAPPAQKPARAKVRRFVKSKAPASAQAKPQASPVKPAPVAPKPAPRTGKRAVMRCGKCGELGYRADGCGRTHNTAGAKPKGKASSDDEDRGALVLDMAPALGTAQDADVRDFGAEQAEPAPARARRQRPSEAVTPGPELAVIPQSVLVTPGPELAVIPQAVLVARLHADRMAADGGDAGGFVARAEPAPTLVGFTSERREVCDVHGWVGAFAFDRDGHSACALELREGQQACKRCKGKRFVTAKTCERCRGLGIEPVVVEERSVDNSDTITSDRPSRENGRLRTKRTEPRAMSVQLKSLTRDVLRAGAAEVDDGQDFAPRPRERSECGQERPCPYVSCRYNLFLDVTEAGSIKLNFPDLEPWELKRSCALDEADAGAHTLEAVAERMNLTRERARQVEVAAGGSLRLALERARIVPRDVKPANAIQSDVTTTTGASE